MSQYPVVTFPDAVDVFIQALNADLADATAYDGPPSPRPARFVVVRRTGGPRLGKVHDNPQLVIEAWGESEEDAADLIQEARGLALALTGSVVDTVPIGRIVEIAGPGLLPDPESDQPRYSLTLSAVLRGT